MNTETPQIETDTLSILCDGHVVSDKRRERLARAVGLGADQATLEILRDATRLCPGPTITIEANRLEGLSRGRGWARMGRGDGVSWAERVAKGYRLTPGRWSIGATDGFSRKDSADWLVSNVKVGSEIWTVAN